MRHRHSGHVATKKSQEVDAVVVMLLSLLFEGLYNRGHGWMKGTYNLRNEKRRIREEANIKPNKEIRNEKSGEYSEDRTTQKKCFR
jgi:hypothetical protein